jgi:hypothetical protein
MTTRTSRIQRPPLAHWINRDDRRPRGLVRAWTGPVAGYDRDESADADPFRRWARALPRSVEPRMR